MRGPAVVASALALLPRGPSDWRRGLGKARFGYIALAPLAFGKFFGSSGRRPGLRRLKAITADCRGLRAVIIGSRFSPQRNPSGCHRFVGLRWLHNNSFKPKLLRNSA